MAGKKSGGRPAGTSHRNAVYVDEQQHALDLLRAGHSQRSVAKITGLARDTVHRIALRGEVDTSRLATQRIGRRYVPSRSVAWCRACGTNVIQPCLRCWLLAQRGEA